jgi:hypothetical protein
MKATPAAVKAAAPEQMALRADADQTVREPSVQAFELSQESLRERASVSTQVMDDILERDRYSYSFRHWGINE